VQDAPDPAPVTGREGSLGLFMVADRLSGVLDELSRTLVVAYQVPNALERLCAQLTGILPVSGCWAVVMDELGGELRFMAASDAVGRKMGALHVELGEGPCLEAARSGERVLIPDLGARDAVERFPSFAAKAMASGVSAVYSFPLRHVDQQVGSVGLFNLAPAELDDLDLELIQLLADLTTVSIVGARRYQQVTGLAAGVQQRLADAAVLEQAKGRLSVQLEVPPGRTLAYLRRYTLTSGITLHEAAEQVVIGDLRLQRTAAGEINRE
jgi:GAF domain-containing protein